MRTRGVPRLTVVRRDDADKVCQLALKMKNVTTVIDELDMLCSGKHWRSEAAKQIVHYGRHDQIGLWGTFRRTQNISEDLVANAHAVFMFRHSEASPRDIDAIRDRFGERYAEVVQRLEHMQFVVWRDAA